MKIKQLINKMRCCSNCEIILVPNGAPREVMEPQFLTNPDEYSEGDSIVDSFQIIDGQLEIFCH